jgi:hypothetical protein
MGSTPSDMFVDRSLTGAIITKRLSNEHRERLSWGIDSFAMIWQVCLDRFKESLIGDQVEYPDAVERTAGFITSCVNGSLHSGWFRLRLGVATRTYLTEASHCNPC